MSGSYEAARDRLIRDYYLAGPPPSSPPPRGQTELASRDRVREDPPGMAARAAAVAASTPDLEPLPTLNNELHRVIERADWSRAAELVDELVGRIEAGEWVWKCWFWPPGTRLGPPTEFAGEPSDCSEAQWIPGAPLELRRAVSRLRVAMDAAREREAEETETVAAQRLRRRRPGEEQERADGLLECNPDRPADDQEADRRAPLVGDEASRGDGEGLRRVATSSNARPASARQQARQSPRRDPQVALPMASILPGGVG